MKVAAIIAEYNPFHNGHAYQIKQLKSMGYDAVICVCSPSFVQRGEAAIFATNVRTKAALAAGADLIISLPAPYALQSAQGFAQAAVYILSALNVCNALAFGAENANAHDLLKVAHTLNSKSFNEELKKMLNTGITYAKAQDKALKKIMPSAKNILKTPNNVLGLEYCKALINLAQSTGGYKNEQQEQTKQLGEQVAVINTNSNKQPTCEVIPISSVIALGRVGANHDEELKKGQKTKFASATAIRKAFYKSENIKHIKKYVPKKCYKIYKQAYKNGQYTSLKKYETALLATLRCMTPEQMLNIRLAGEGLHNRLYKCVQGTTNLQQLYTALKTKRYTMARLRRLVINSALNYTQQLPFVPPYAHVLGASNKGVLLLKQIKKCSKINFSQSLAQLARQNNSAKIIANAHAKAEDFAQLCLKNAGACNSAYTDKFVMHMEYCSENKQ